MIKNILFLKGFEGWVRGEKIFGKLFGIFGSGIKLKTILGPKEDFRLGIMLKTRPFPFTLLGIQGPWRSWFWDLFRSYAGPPFEREIYWVQGSQRQANCLMVMFSSTMFDFFAFTSCTSETTRGHKIQTLTSCDFPSYQDPDGIAEHGRACWNRAGSVTSSRGVKATPGQ